MSNINKYMAEFLEDGSCTGLSCKDCSLDKDITVGNRETNLCELMVDHIDKTKLKGDENNDNN